MTRPAFSFHREFSLPSAISAGTRLGRFMVGAAVVALTALPGLRAQSNDTFTGISTSLSLNTSANWSGGLPTSTNTVLFNASSPGGTYFTNASLTYGTISFSTAATSKITTSGSSALSLTLDGLSGEPLIELDSANHFTLTSSATSTLTLVLGTTSATIDSESSGATTFGSNITEATAGTSLAFTNITGTGSSTIALTGVNSFTGGLAVTGNGVEVDVTADSALGGAGGSITINGGRLGIGTNNVTIDPTRSFFLGANPAGGNSTGTLSIKGTVTVTYDGVIQDLNGSTHGDLVKQGAATFAIGGANTYTGNTFINNGTVLILADNSLPSGTTVNLGQGASPNLGALDLNGHNQQIAGLNSTVGTTTTSTNLVTSATAATLTFGGNSSYSFGSSTTTNSGLISGDISVVMAGTGTQALGGANTYTGSTTINAGTLAINGSTAAASAVTVNTTGTLAGAGKVNGAVTVASGGAIAAGGSSTPGALTLGSNLTLNGGSALNFRIGSTTADQLILSGNSITATGPSSGTVTINLLNFNGTAALGTYTLLSFTGTGTTTASWALGDFSLAADPTLAGSSLFLGGDGMSLDVSVVPEPATYAAFFGALALVGAACRRRRQ